MNQLFRTALAARASIVAPIRRARLQRMAAAGEAPVSVLFYHRVADHCPNPWTLSRDQFRRHVDYCCEHLTLIDLPEVQRRVATGHSPSPAVSFTFDDGYADNGDFALPLLIERGIPCTYFVTVDHMKTGRPFLHDLRRRHPLEVHSVEQLRELSDAGIELGCHANTHVDFSRVESVTQIHREIIDAKDELEQMIGKPVRYFAFPYGFPSQLTRDAIRAVQVAGYAGFCSAFGSYNLPGRDAFHIRRCHGDQEFSRFVNWLCFDESKLRREPVISYDLPAISKEIEAGSPETRAAKAGNPCVAPLTSPTTTSVSQGSNTCA